MDNYKRSFRKDTEGILNIQSIIFWPETNSALESLHGLPHFFVIPPQRLSVPQFSNGGMCTCVKCTEDVSGVKINPGSQRQ